MIDFFKGFSFLHVLIFITENLVIYFVNLWYRVDDLIINLFQLNLNYKNLDFYFLRQGLGFTNLDLLYRDVLIHGR